MSNVENINLQTIQTSLLEIQKNAEFNDPYLGEKFSAIIDEFLKLANISQSMSNETASEQQEAMGNNSSVDPMQVDQVNKVNELNISTNEMIDKLSDTPVMKKVIIDNSTSFILNDPYASRKFRPTPDAFAKVTDISPPEAFSLIQAAISSGRDFRNWEKIMSSVDPVASLRRANNEVYNSNLNHSLNEPDKNYIGSRDVVARSGNFAVISNDKGYQRLMLVAKDGLMLDEAGPNGNTIVEKSQRFGFDVNELKAIIPIMRQNNASLALQIEKALSLAS